MRGLKGVIVVTTIIAAAAILGACQSYKDCGANCALKFGAGDVVVENSSR